MCLADTAVVTSNFLVSAFLTRNDVALWVSFFTASSSTVFWLNFAKIILRCFDCCTEVADPKVALLYVIFKLKKKKKK